MPGGVDDGIVDRVRFDGEVGEMFVTVGVVGVMEALAVFVMV